MLLKNYLNNIKAPLQETINHFPSNDNLSFTIGHINLINQKIRTKQETVYNYAIFLKNALLTN